MQGTPLDQLQQAAYVSASSVNWLCVCVCVCVTDQLLQLLLLLVGPLKGLNQEGVPLHYNLWQANTHTHSSSGDDASFAKEADNQWIQAALEG